MSLSTLSTKGTADNALKIAFEHMLQVRPLACKLACLNCAFVLIANSKQQAINIFFMIIFISYE